MNSKILQTTLTGQRNRLIVNVEGTGLSPFT